MSTQTLILIGLILIGTVWFGIAYLRANKKMKTLVDARPSLSEDEIYERYYAGSGLKRDAVIEAWIEVARVLNLPAGQLRPEDRFGEEIVGRYAVDNELDELSELASKRFKAAGKEWTPEQIKTIGEYVEQLAALEN